MTREDFWTLIDSARSAAHFTRANLPDALHDELSQLDEPDLLDFLKHFHELRCESYRQDLFAAAWILGGSASDEDFSDFRDWLITLGRDAYDDALHNPQCIPNHTDPSELRDPFDPRPRQIALDLYEHLTGHPLPANTLRPEPREMSGQPWRPEDLPRRHPKLWRLANPD